MTKKVRIENADTSDHKVMVQVWIKGSGESPDILKEEKELGYPTQMSDFLIFKEQYLVVKEF